MRERLDGKPACGDRCPRCRQAGHVVGVSPVRAHRPEATYGGWQYCTTAGCRVVFYLGRDAIDEDEAATRVGHKASWKSEPVCYCFTHTAFSLALDLDTNGGQSTISRAIRRAGANGLTACEHLNPSGECCLPRIGCTLEAIRQFTTL